MLSRIAVSLAVVTAAFTAPPAQAATLPAPTGLTPAAGAAVEGVPPVTWNAVRGAEQYEFQVSADKGFGSRVERRIWRTKNTAGTVKTALADGTYYWRVRALGPKDKAGRWTKPRSFVKNWTTVPTLLEPNDALSISWPGRPLLLRWTPVPHASKYFLMVATDPNFANPVLGSVKNPLQTQGTVFSMDKPLNSGRYYWAVTPVDTGNFRGRQSRVGTFEWNWPTGTSNMTVTDSDGDASVFDPLLEWQPIAGAVRYEVEINPTEEHTGGSRVFRGFSNGNRFAPPEHLPNNVFDWRVRAIDADNNVGQWNSGPAFRKKFDAEITGVRIGDDRTDDVGPSRRTAMPFFSWNPVPGAVAYRVEYKRHTGACGWLPLATAAQTTPNSFFGGRPLLSQEGDYCLRIAALDSFGNASRWTYVNGAEGVAFTHAKDAPRAAQAACPLPGVSTSITPCAQPGTPVQYTPYFRWNPVDCAVSYKYYITHDDEITNVAKPPAETGTTTSLMYAPTRQLLDETTVTAYHITVVGVNASGNACHTVMTSTFSKRSEAPPLMEPSDGSNAPIQQVFRWKHVPGAHHYQLQVAEDPNFGKLLEGNPITGVSTASSAYASQKAYPAHTRLYWRVRAVMREQARDYALNWSEPRWFSRDLPIPAHENGLTGGENIPVFSWEYIQGAISYDMHVDQSDGTARDFRNLKSTSFTPIGFLGTGVWRWKVRANFPGGVSGGFSQSQEFVRRINAPAAGKVDVSGRDRMLFRWSPDGTAARYRIEVSTSDSFAKVGDWAITYVTSWAPDLTKPIYRDGGTLWWRLAAVDGGNNVGAYTMGRVAVPKLMTVSAKGALKRRRTGSIMVTVRDSKGGPVSSAALRSSGAGSKAAKGRTGRTGAGRIRIRATRKGTVKIRVIKRGYLNGTLSLRVR